MPKNVQYPNFMQHYAIPYDHHGMCRAWVKLFASWGAFQSEKAVKLAIKVVTLLSL